MWHFELHLEEIKRLPVRLPPDEQTCKPIVSLIDQIQELKNETAAFQLGTQRASNIRLLEHLLNEAVFDLYELSEPERDQIRDMCSVGIEFFYNSFQSDDVKPALEQEFHLAPCISKLGRLNDVLECEKQFYSDFLRYLRVFIEGWNRELAEEEAELSYQIIQSSDSFGLLALVFSAQEKAAESLPKPKPLDSDQWTLLLNELSENSVIPFFSSQIYIDGMVRTISGDNIILIKRNERRLWTRSTAREDLEALFVQAMRLKSINPPTR